MPSSVLPNPEVSVNPPVLLYSFDVVVRFGEGDVFGEDVGVVSAGRGPGVYVAVAGVVAGQGSVGGAVAFEAFAEIEGAELDILFGLVQVFLVGVLIAQRAGNLYG